MDVKVKVIGRIELPEQVVYERKCPCCGMFKPESEFSASWGFADCHACEAEQFTGTWIPSTPYPSNIEQCFQEEWMQEIEEDWAIDDL